MLPIRRLPRASGLLLALAGLAGASGAGATTALVNVSSVVSFGGQTTNGTVPRGDVLLGADGNFYLTTSAGGDSGGGVVLKVTPGGTATPLKSFAGGAEGNSPYAGVTLASDGNFYGTTYLGGDNSAGTVYRLTPAGTFTTLFSFTDKSQGAFLPYAGLTQLGTGDLYGTTLRGGTADAGTAIRVKLDGTVSTIHSFTGADGKNPEGLLAAGNDGNLYGTTLIGGDNDRGTVFRMTPDGTVTVLYSFPPLTSFTAAGVAANSVGANPRAGLLLGADGNFYGTAYQGGTSGYGTVFRITPTGTLTVLHQFAGSPFDGASPLASLRRLADGSLVGTTERGGSSGAGTVWRIDAAGNYTVLHSLTSTPVDGAASYSNVVELNGALYGLSSSDATYSAGAFYKLDLASTAPLGIQLSVAPNELTVGAQATVTWSAPSYASCVAGGAWSDTIATSGSRAVTPFAGVNNYSIACTDANNVVRTANVALLATSPALQPVDGGGDGGGGALDAALLALLGAALGFTVFARRRA